uniref:ShKT domain-containing protein n=1 Tax=Caenorhabditis japonica TaxID=281687 RepID=A0A8R1HS76_CAEJA
MLRQFLISFAVFSVAYACDASVSEGPCDGTVLLCQTQVCDTTAGQCCPETTVASDASTTVASVSSTTAAATTASASVTSASTASCVDLVNPSTGVSDCTALAYLCTDSTYYDVMTQQCPKTCGRCSSTSSSSSSSSSSTSCADLLNPSTGVSDCPSRASLCNDATYYSLMTTQCPKTCGRCSSSSSSSSTAASASSSTSCADLLNPSTGVSDCPSRASLCNDADYYTLMTQQCPKTCGRCSSSSSSTAASASASSSSSSSSSSSTSCADLLNPSTGVSDCPSRASLCNNSVYYDLMTQQCPKTCGRCSSSSSSSSSAVSATSSSSSSTASTTCVDKVNPSTGVSDCPNRVAYCTNSAYITLMRTQCPLTCGFCTSG